MPRNINFDKTQEYKLVPHDSPVPVSQFKNHPTQGDWRNEAAQSVPYQSGPSTPNAAVTRRGVSVFDPKPNR